MDSDSEKLCMEEIDHLVLDNNKKVTLTYISNTWNVPSKDGEVILEKWLENYTGDRSIVKEYLIRGDDTNGNSIITVVPEKSLPKVGKVCPKFTKTLYSVEIGSINGKSLNVHEPTGNKFISLKIKSNPRNVKVHKIVIPQSEKAVKKEVDPPKKSNPFGMASSKLADKKDIKAQQKVTESSKDTKVKEEKTSPKKQSPKKNQSSQLKAQPSKSIASFFGSKPSTSTSNASKTNSSVAEATSKIESVKIKDEPVEVTSNDTKNTQKRSHSNTSDSNEDVKSVEKKQTKKKMKLEPKSQRSRLMQICDSSSDEEDASNGRNSEDVKMDAEEEVVVKKEKENKTPSPDKTANNKTNGSSSGKRRIKVKRSVTKTYEDDEGFINTVHEIEEVSCSEEEEVAPPPPKKAAPIISNGSNGSNGNNANAPKKKISPPAGKKQGSILSFFGKK